MRRGFDTSACQSGGGVRELEALRQLGATPPALVRRAVTAVQQVFIDPTPTRGSRATAVAVSAT